MGNRNKKITGLILGAVVAVGGVVGGLTYAGNSHSTKVASSSKPSTSAVQSAQTQVPTTNVKYDGQDGKTALELLKSKASVETKQSSFGEFVVSINGNDGGGTKYWLYYVNGQEANVGAGAYDTKASDKIEWKLQ